MLIDYIRRPRQTQGGARQGREVNNNKNKNKNNNSNSNNNNTTFRAMVYPRPAGPCLCGQSSSFLRGQLQ